MFDEEGAMEPENNLEPSRIDLASSSFAETDPPGLLQINLAVHHTVDEIETHQRGNDLLASRTQPHLHSRRKWLRPSACQEPCSRLPTVAFLFDQSLGDLKLCSA